MQIAVHNPNQKNHDIDPDLASSKTQRKNAMHELQDIGEQLVELNNDKLMQLNLSESLFDAVLEAKRIGINKHEGRRRQMQYIGKLMRDIDATAIRNQLAEWGGESRQHTAWIHLLEHWRERLLADESAFTELAQEYPAADVQHLRTLVRNAHKEKLANKAPRNFRQVFQELRELVPLA